MAGDPGNYEIVNRLRPRKMVSYSKTDEVSYWGYDEVFKKKFRQEKNKAKLAQVKQVLKQNAAKSKEMLKKQLVEASASIEGDSSDSSDEEEDDYEQMCQRNIKERMELIQSLGIVGLKTELEVVKPKKISIKAPPKAPVPLREKSLRLKAGHGSYSMQSLQHHLVINGKCDRNFQDISDFIHHLQPALSNNNNENLELGTCEVNTNTLSSLQVHEFSILREKYIGDVTSLALHPAQDTVLLAAGTCDGFLGLWDVRDQNRQPSYEVLRPHNLDINCLSFDLYTPSNIYMSSKDGSMFKGDLMKMSIDQVCVVKNINTKYSLRPQWFDQKDPHTLIVGFQTGEIGVCDNRASSEPVNLYKCHQTAVETVHNYPPRESMFLTASGSEASIWDVRFWGRKNRNTANHICNVLLPFTRASVDSAFFSCHGNYLLTSSKDQHLRIFDSSQLSTTTEPKGSGQKFLPVVHRNGHLLVDRTVLNICQSHVYETVVKDTKDRTYSFPWSAAPSEKALWCPQREDTFLIGRKSYETETGSKANLVICDLEGQAIYTHTDTNTSKYIVYVWHPSKPIIASVIKEGVLTLCIQPNQNTSL